MTATLATVSLRSVPVVEPQTSLAEAIDLLHEEPLKTVVLVGDEMYMGVFNEDALHSGQIPKGVDKTTLQVGPYALSLNSVGTLSMTLEQAKMVMRRRNLRVLPVVDNRVYKGVVTVEDLG